MAKKKSKKSKKEKPKKSGNLVVVRVRGKINLTGPVRSTLEMLNLHNKNWCTVVPNNDSMTGMIKKVKDYVTWGEISDNLFDELIEKRGEEIKEGGLKKGKKSYRKYFRLSPPRKGYGRKGVKVSFSKGGALGYRGKEIEDLIKRMI